jgi:hypothetical protein
VTQRGTDTPKLLRIRNRLTRPSRYPWRMFLTVRLSTAQRMIPSNPSGFRCMTKVRMTVSRTAAKRAVGVNQSVKTDYASCRVLELQAGKIRPKPKLACLRRKDRRCLKADVLTKSTYR